MGPRKNNALLYCKNWGGGFMVKITYIIFYWDIQFGIC
jgi:hypothetical protein